MVRKQNVWRKIVVEKFGEISINQNNIKDIGLYFIVKVEL